MPLLLAKPKYLAALAVSTADRHKLAAVSVGEVLQSSRG